MQMSLRAGIGALVIVSGLSTAAPAIADTEIGTLGRAHGTTIQGIVADVFGNRFVLEDATGRVLVSSGPHWHHQLTLRKGERVTVNGELDGDEFDAFTITRQDGEVVAIRPAEGPPPWARGPDSRPF